jgi:hypothetical protein
MDLISLLLTLRPLDGDRAGGSLPTWWGRAAQALALQVFNQLDPALAQALHQGSALRPFTTSTLMGRMQEGRLDPAGSYALRFTGLTTPVSDLLAAAAQPGGALAPGATPASGLPAVPVEAALTAGHPWAGRSWLCRAGRRHPGRRPAAPARLSAGQPHLLSFGWTAGSAAAAGAGLWQPGGSLECLCAAGLSGRGAPLRPGMPGRGPLQPAHAAGGGKDGGLRVGAVGQISYVTLNYDRYWMGVLAALADFARFSGIGGGATTGLGQARRWQSDRPAG